MATRWIRDKTLNQIAETIRDTISGSESTLTMRPGEMPDLIRSIPTAATTVTSGDGMVATAGNIASGYVAFVNGEKIVGTSTIGNTITETNITIAQTYATYTVTADPGYAFKTVTVAPIAIPTVSVTPTSVNPTSVTQIITPPTGYNGFSSVTVSAVPTAHISVQSRYHVTDNIAPGICNPIITINAIPSGYENITNVTASAADVLPSKVIVNSAGETISGAMHTKSATTSYILNKNDVITVTAGQYLSGAQIIGISSTERAKIISQNIASGVTILGVSGTHGSISSNWPYDGTAPYSFWAEDVVNDFDNLNDYNGFDGVEFLNLCANIANQNSLTNSLKTCFRCFASYQYEDVISKLYFTNSDNYSLYRLANDCVYIAQYITGHNLSDLTLSGNFSFNDADILAYTLYYWIIQNSLIDSKFDSNNYNNFNYETPFIYNFPSLHDIIYYDTNPSNFVNLSSNIDFILPINLPVQWTNNQNPYILFTPYFDTFDETILVRDRYSSNIWFSLYIDNMYYRYFLPSGNNYNNVLRENWINTAIYSSELDSTAIIPYYNFDTNQYYGTLCMVAYHKGSYNSYNQPNVIKNFIALPEFAMTLTL